MGRKEDIVNIIEKVSSIIGKPMIEGEDFEVIHQPLIHNPLALPKGK